ncbi:MAG: hypothetical protein GX231_08460 [Tissierellia bacterium]|jgi:hypothetical protein|nr:hypothetical protein [Tissierellia bacterium]
MVLTHWQQVIPRREIKDPNLWGNEEWVKGVFNKLMDIVENLDFYL